jgi:hypothetical protein
MFSRYIYMYIYISISIYLYIDIYIARHRMFSRRLWKSVQSEVLEIWHAHPTDRVGAVCVRAKMLVEVGRAVRGGLRCVRPPPPAVRAST